MAQVPPAQDQMHYEAMAQEALAHMGIARVVEDHFSKTYSPDPAIRMASLVVGRRAYDGGGDGLGRQVLPSCRARSITA